jgi:hypothetical protein
MNNRGQRTFQKSQIFSVACIQVLRLHNYDDFCPLGSVFFVNAPLRQRLLPAAKQEQTAGVEGMTHDKAKWHLEGEFPRELDRQQAYVPGGMLVAWVTERGLLSELAGEDFADELARLRARSNTGGQAYRLLGGVLESDLLNDEADAFFGAYLDPDSGGYWTDYGVIAAGLPSQYHVRTIGPPTTASRRPSTQASRAGGPRPASRHRNESRWYENPAAQKEQQGFA